MSLSIRMDTVHYVTIIQCTPPVVNKNSGSCIDIFDGSGKIKAQTVVANQKEKSVPIPNTVIQPLYKSMQGRFWFLGKEELCEKT